MQLEIHISNQWWLWNQLLTIHVGGRVPYGAFKEFEFVNNRYSVKYRQGQCLALLVFFCYFVAPGKA
jgi:hypothetical protein